jgi:hypothetical protein
MLCPYIWTANELNVPSVPRNKQICSGDAMASNFQKRVLVNRKSNIRVRLMQNSPAAVGETYTGAVRWITNLDPTKFR